MTDRHRSQWTAEESIAHQQELDARRREWEEQRRIEREVTAREEAQARTEAWLLRRGESYLHHTGMLPSPELREQWLSGYVVERVGEEDAERGQKLAEAAGDVL